MRDWLLVLAVAIAAVFAADAMLRQPGQVIGNLMDDDAYFLIRDDRKMPIWVTRQEADSLGLYWARRDFPELFR